VICSRRTLALANEIPGTFTELAPSSGQGRVRVNAVSFRLDVPLTLGILFWLETQNFIAKRSLGKMKKG
jgi:hypothetical protein